MTKGGKVVLKGIGRIWMPKETMRGGARIYIPASVVLDSQFPFKEDEEIIVEIDTKNRIIKLKSINEK